MNTDIWRCVFLSDFLLFFSGLNSRGCRNMVARSLMLFGFLSSLLNFWGLLVHHEPYHEDFSPGKNQQLECFSASTSKTKTEWLYCLDLFNEATAFWSTKRAWTFDLDWSFSQVYAERPGDQAQGAWGLGLANNPSRSWMILWGLPKTILLNSEKSGILHQIGTTFLSIPLSWKTVAHRSAWDCLWTEQPFTLHQCPQPRSTDWHWSVGHLVQSNVTYMDSVLCIY